ncbi:hypothetical protein ACN22W_09465 [Burkholderia theae]|uniref:hypothetical protein n=1 Tax=Burkholderia theae TaxID=3143496 RepID=UPI003AFB615A
MTMILSHSSVGRSPFPEVLSVIDDFGTLWTLVPAEDFFGTYELATALAAIAFERSGEVH